MIFWQLGNFSTAFIKKIAVFYALAAVFEQFVLLFLGQTVVSAFTYLVQDAVCLCLLALLTGIIVPVALMTSLL